MRSEFIKFLLGEEPLEADPEGADTRLFREALEDLEPQARLFVELDQIEQASPLEIEREMRLSPQEFRVLKREVLTALRTAMLKRL